MNSQKEIDYSDTFHKQLKKAPLEIKIAFRKRLELFLLDQSDSQLRNHILAGKYKGLRSINITGDWRALFREEKENGDVVFVLLGTHSQLYK
jgi:addiction module RelE/StbE family toxin